MKNKQYMIRKVLISEFSAWHDECLYSTCLLLKSEGYHVVVALNEDLRNRIEDSLNEVSDEIIYYPFKKGLKGGIALLRFWRFVLNGGFTHLYLNSAQGSVAWKFFLLPIPHRIKIIGTLHNIKKLSSSFGQKIITRRIDGYVLLSDLLTKRYQEVCNNKPSVAVYPVYYPKFNTHKLLKNEGEVWIVIPGAVSFSRRDYLALLPPDVSYNSHIKFVILGNKNKADGNVVYEKVSQAGLLHNFVFFDGFVPEEEFYSYVLQCDYIMPLIHPNHGEYGKYVTEKISGTYNLATAYRKIMLCPQEMNTYEDFQDSSLFYSINDIQTFVNSLKPTNNSENFYQHPKWKQKEQQKRLVDFLKRIN
jgi:hypothetical protein